MAWEGSLLEMRRDSSSPVKISCADIDGVSTAVRVSRLVEHKLRVEPSRSAVDVSGRAWAALPFGEGPATVGEAIHGLLCPDGPAHRYGTSLADIYAHSWRRIPSQSWRWIPTHSVLGELGFPARASEVRRWGGGAREVRQNHIPPPLSRSFASVVREGVMDRGRGCPPRQFGDSAGRWSGGNRSAPNEWIEEDDLLGEDELRAKLRREQEQKRTFPGGHPGEIHSSGMSSRADNRNLGVTDRAQFEHSQGWQQDFHSRGNFDREGVFHKNFQGRGDARGGFGAQGAAGRSDKSRSMASWGDAWESGKVDETKKGWGEIGANTRVLRVEDRCTCFRCLQSSHH